MPTCDQATIDANKLFVEQLYGNNHNYYELHVKIVATDRANGSVTFAAENAEDLNGNRVFTMTWGDSKNLWAACPSTLPSQAQGANAGPLPLVGATGTLYVAIDYLNGNNILTPPKWPKIQ
jgi:hypothetical protein